MDSVVRPKKQQHEIRLFEEDNVRENYSGFESIIQLESVGGSCVGVYRL